MRACHLGVASRKVCAGILDMEEVPESEVVRGCSGGNRAVKSSHSGSGCSCQQRQHKSSGSTDGGNAPSMLIMKYELKYIMYFLAPNSDPLSELGSSALLWTIQVTPYSSTGVLFCLVEPESVFVMQLRPQFKRSCYQ